MRRPGQMEVTLAAVIEDRLDPAGEHKYILTRVVDAALEIQ